jgi:acetyl-CoA synthetase
LNPEWESKMAEEKLDHLLKKESVIYPPPKEFVEKANVKDYEAEYKRRNS